MKVKKKKEFHYPEHEIQDQIIRYLKKKQYFFWRNNVGRKHNLQFGLKGSADILGTTQQGIFFAIEVKDHKGKQSPEQKRFEEKVNANNAIYILARDLITVTEVL